MSPHDTARRLVDLPADAASLAADVVSAGHSLLASSALRLGGAPGPLRGMQSLYLLRGASLSWRLYVVREQQSIVLFWNGRPTADVLAEAQLRMRLETVDRALEGGADEDAVMSFRVARPDIIIEDPRPEDIPLHPDFQYEEETCVLLRVGPSGEGRLCVKHPEKQGGLIHADVILGEGGSWRMIERGGVFSGKWEAAPFFALLDSLRSWACRNPAAAADAPFPMPPPGGPSTELQLLVRSIAEAYVSVSRDVAAPIVVPPGGPPWLDAFAPAYRVAELGVDASLRLDVDGHLATADDAPFGIGLTARVEPAERGACLRISIVPPDFVVVGDRHEAFCGALLRWLAGVSLDELDLVDPRGFVDFVERAARDAVYFRTRRDGGEDTYAAVLSAPFQGRTRKVLLLVLTRAPAAGGAPELEVLDVSCEYDDADDVEKPMSDGSIDYFFSLIESLAGWSKASR